ncbi:MAG: helix-turn-helix domain-containing protein [Lachnospiraceae bacterium]
MEALLNAGHSVKEIANQLHVHQATIYREYNRVNICTVTLIIQKRNVIVVIWASRHMIGI